MRLTAVLLFGFGLFLGGCVSVRDLYGITGADEGVRVSAGTTEYHVFHPGLDIIIREDYSGDLLRIESLGRSSPAPLRHTVTYGTPNRKNVLQIVGRFSKEITLNGIYYGKVLRGRLLVERGQLYLDQKKLSPVKKTEESSD